MKNIWIDTDPGLDDALALIWAVQQEKALNWKIQGISTVNGNLALPQVNGNAYALLEHLKRQDIPLYEGVSKALIEPELHAAQVHGKALGPFNPSPIEKLSEKKGPVALAHCLSQLDGMITLVTIGPLTNIAIFLCLYPELKIKIEHIFIMGGGTYGNVTHYAEFNISVDPEAAKIVFDSAIPITMSGLDISESYTYLSSREMDKYLSLAKNSWTKPIIEFFAREYTESTFQIPLYDPTAMVAAAYPEIFTYYSSPVTVDLGGTARGMTLIPTRPAFEVPLPKHITTQVIESCDREIFLEILFKGL